MSLIGNKLSKTVFILFFFIIVNGFILIRTKIYNNKTKTKICFWNTKKQGTNIFNQHISAQDIQAAKDYGFEFIRLAPDKFLTKKRDFLIGDADNYNGLVDLDLIKLKEVLDICTEVNMPVVLTMLSLPGSRWKQNNNDKDDLRIWNTISPTAGEVDTHNNIFQKQAATFWKDLASELQHYSIIVGYNILNEPHPEKLFLSSEKTSSPAETITEIIQNKIQLKVFEFYQLSIDAIRSIDKQTPILLDSPAHADPQTFKYLSSHHDPYIIYSFHMYEPYEYTNLQTNKGNYYYPGIIKNKHWDQQILINYLQEVVNFQKRNNIDSNRILVGEFGGHRKTKGLEIYFKDLISIFKQNNWHYAFYAFREDTWDGMDYELGNNKIPWNSSAPLPSLRNAHNSLFKVLLQN